MKKGIEIIPTVVPASFEDVVNAREKYREFSASLHVDTADGRFAPNVTWEPSVEEVKLFPDADTTLYEAHMMVMEPLNLGIAFAQAGAKRITAHVEAFKDSKAGHLALDAWRENGAHEAGVGILLSTPLENLEPYVEFCDFILLMTIASVGQQGIPFDERGIARVLEMHRRHPKLTIAVDGGVSEKNIVQLARAGATRFSVGSALAKASDPAAAYENLKKLAEAV